MKLPDKFEVCLKSCRDEKYTVTKGVDEAYFLVQTVARSLDDAYDTLVKYPTATVQNLINKGHWTITRNLTERELVLPFEFTTYPNGSYSYKATQGTDENRLNCRGDWQVDNLYTKDEAKKNIKNGIWIVTSVGTTEEGVYNDINWDEVTLEPLEAPSSNDSNKLELSIEVDAKDALEAVNDLTAALQHLEVVYERVKCLFNQ